MNNITSSATSEGIAKGLDNVVDEAQQLLKSAADSGDARFQVLRDKFVVQVRQMREHLEDLQDAAVEKAKEAARTTDDAVHEHPYGAMGIAAAAGLLIGFLIARR